MSEADSVLQQGDAAQQDADEDQPVRRRPGLPPVIQYTTKSPRPPLPPVSVTALEEEVPAAPDGGADQGEATATP